MRGAPREVKDEKFVLSTLLLPPSLSLSHGQRSDRLLHFLSVPVAQLIKAQVAEKKVVGSILNKANSFLLLSFFILDKFLMIKLKREKGGWRALKMTGRRTGEKEIERSALKMNVLTCLRTLLPPP